MRLALDHSAVAGGTAATGIARYVNELTTALRQTRDVELIDRNELDLWSGISTWRSGGVAGCIRGAIREYLRLPGAIRKLGIHVFHVPGSRAPARHVAVPLVVTIHDLAAFEYPDMQGSRRGVQLRGQIRSAIARAELLITPTESVREEIAQRFPEGGSKVRVVHHGVTERFHRPRQYPDVPTFVSVATLERRKNLGTLIDAFRHVHAQHPAARLRLIGQPQSELRGLQERLALLGLESQVSVEGYLSDDSVAGAFAGATASVYPSLYEGFGLPVVESMAAGAPVIVSDLNVSREVAGDAALFVNSRDAAAIAEAMLRIINEQGLSESLSATGRERAAEFTWARSARAHCDVYREAMERWSRRVLK